MEHAEGYIHAEPHPCDHAWCSWSGQKLFVSFSRASDAAQQRPQRWGGAWVQAAPDAFEEEGGELRQIKPDEAYRHPAPLWRAYKQCVARARLKATTRRCAAAPWRYPLSTSLHGLGPRHDEPKDAGNPRAEHSGCVGCTWKAWQAERR